jgi:hypothetical protein
MKVTEHMDTITATIETKPAPIFGVMGAVESSDSMNAAGANMDLRQFYISQLFRRDAEIWHQRTARMTVAESDDPMTITPHNHRDIKAPTPHKGGTANPANHFRRDEPCPQCGTFMFYVSNPRTCVECMKRRNRAVKVAKLSAKKHANVVELRPQLRGLRSTQLAARPKVPPPEQEFMRVHEKQPRWSDQ